MAETELWLADLEKVAAALEALETATPRLSEDCDRRFAAVTDPASRRERRLSHIALRIVLERRLGLGIRRVSFVRNATGKPALADGGASFSLAHTPGFALVAVGGGGPLGVDIERMRTVEMPEARRAPIEQAAVALAGGAPLAGTDRDARFLSAWVRLEAVAKAEGAGIGPLLARLRPGRPLHGWDPSAEEGIKLAVHDIPVTDGLFAAVALPWGEGPPALRHIPATAPAISALLAPDDGQRSR